MRRISLLIVLLSLNAASAGGVLRAQTPPGDDQHPGTTHPAPSPSRLSGPGQRVTEILPHTFLLEKRDGTFQHVLNWTYEDFWEIYRRQLSQQSLRPDSTPMSVHATGAVIRDSTQPLGDYANIELEFEIRVEDREWVSVPLRLDEVVLRDKVVEVLDDNGRVLADVNVPNYIDVDAQLGYVWWVRAGDQTTYRVKLHVLAEVTSSGGERRLAMTLPPVPTSTFTLRIPDKDVDVRIVSGAGAVRHARTQPDGTTELVLEGVRAEFEIGWREPSPRPDDAAVLSARGEVTVTIDEETVRTEAALTVFSMNSVAFDRFHVTLPDGAQLEPGNDGDEQIEDISLQPIRIPDRAAPSRGVRVTLREKTTDEVQVRIRVRRTDDDGGFARGIDLGGFSVVEAGVQSGRVAVRSVDDRHVLYSGLRGVRQIDATPATPNGDEDTTTFEYKSQPFLLAARIMPHVARVAVRPEYVATVHEDRIELTGRLTYDVRGPPVYTVDINPGTWSHIEVGPIEQVFVEEILSGGERLLRVSRLEPGSGEFTLQLRGDRPLPAGSEQVVIDFPRPVAQRVEPAAVFIVPDDNVILLPRSGDMTGMLRQQREPTYELPQRQQPPFGYVAVSRAGRFVADFSVHPQRIAASSGTDFTFNQAAAQFEAVQRIRYVVEYEPVRSLLLSVPEPLTEPGRLVIRLDDADLVYATAVDDITKQEGMRLMRVDLPDAKIGSSTLVLSYFVPFDAPSANSGDVARLPLVSPALESIGAYQSELRVTVPDGLLIGLRDDEAALLADLHMKQTSPTQFEIATSRPADSLEVVVEAQGWATVVERSWIQARLAEDTRYFRTAFRFSTRERQLRIALPRDIDSERCRIVLDDRELAVSIRQDGTFVLDLPESDPTTAMTSHRLEVEYDLAGGGSGLGRLEIVAPRFRGATWMQRTYWQLVFPQDRHLVVGPHGFTGEHRWVWHRCFWKREPLLDQDELERWAGAVHHESLPQAANCYLFSTLGGDEIDVYVADRTLIVLAFSAVSLAAGLLLLYVPAMRRPWVLLTAAIGLGLLGVNYPESSLFLLQAAGMGGALTVVAAVLKSIVDRRGGTVIHSSPSSVLERGMLPSVKARRKSGRLPSTETARMIVDASPSSHVDS